MSTRRKMRFAQRFYSHPVLYHFVKIFLFSVWFRVAFVSFLLLPVVLWLILGKIWRTTPSGFRPQFKINAVDWVQAKSLERTAVRELEQGHAKEGLLSYQMAILNNPGDAARMRRFLRRLAEQPDPRPYYIQGVNHAFWLLRLSQTNLADLELTATLFGKLGLEDLAADVLQSRQSELSPSLAKVYLKALFNSDRIAQFDAFGRTMPRAADLLRDTEMKLYLAAYKEGWGAPTVGSNDVGTVDLFFDDPQWRILAHQLYLRVCAQQEDVGKYWNTMTRLEEWNSTRLLDHVRGWWLLMAAGRQTEALVRARASHAAPVTVQEGVALARCQHTLGLREEAYRVLERAKTEHPYSDKLWLLQSELMLADKEWEKLRRLALEMRLNAVVRDQLEAFSYYLEGRVELSSGGPKAAQTIFAKIPAAQLSDRNVALVIASGLVELGYATVARDLLQSREGFDKSNPGSWNVLLRIAQELKDGALLQNAARQAYDLQPTNLAAMNNHAVALLIHRREPQETLELTSRLFELRPKVSSVVINHALALNQNGRHAEADRLLAGIDPKVLNPSEQSIYHLACLETLVKQERLELARTYAEKVNVNYLFPSQREYLIELRRALSAMPQPNPAQSGEILARP